MLLDNHQFHRHRDAAEIELARGIKKGRGCLAPVDNLEPHHPHQAGDAIGTGFHHGFSSRGTEAIVIRRKHVWRVLDGLAHASVDHTTGCQVRTYILLKQTMFPLAIDVAQDLPGHQAEDKVVRSIIVVIKPKRGQGTSVIQRKIDIDLLLRRTGLAKLEEAVDINDVVFHLSPVAIHAHRFGQHRTQGAAVRQNEHTYSCQDTLVFLE